MNTTKTTWLTLLFLSATLAGVFPTHAYYDPGAQRWINRDPLGETGFEAIRGRAPIEMLAFVQQGRHKLFTFVDNNPGNSIDAFGLMSPMDCAAIMRKMTKLFADAATAYVQHEYLTAAAKTFQAEVLMSIYIRMCNPPAPPPDFRCPIIFPEMPPNPYERNRRPNRPIYIPILIP